MEAVFCSGDGCRVKVAVCSCVGEVVAEGEADVFLAFNDCRAQIFIALHDEELVLGTKSLKGKALVAQEVLSDRFRAAKMGCYLGFELAEAIRKRRRDVAERWLPCRTGEGAFGLRGGESIKKHRRSMLRWSRGKAPFSEWS